MPSLQLLHYPFCIPWDIRQACFHGLICEIHPLKSRKDSRTPCMSQRQRHSFSSCPSFWLEIPSSPSPMPYISGLHLSSSHYPFFYQSFFVHLPVSFIFTLLFTPLESPVRDQRSYGVKTFRSEEHTS